MFWLRIEGIEGELYNVIVLKRVRPRMSLDFQSDEILRIITIVEDE